MIFKKILLSVLYLSNSFEEQQPFIDLANQILSIKKENLNADTSPLENEIDQLVYKLYNLTPEEIKIIEDRVK